MIIKRKRPEAFSLIINMLQATFQNLQGLTPDDKLHQHQADQGIHDYAQKNALQ